MTSAPSTSNGGNEKDRLWYFTAEQLASSPSRRHGIDSDQELSFRQMTAYLIQEMGQRLQVSQLCINTAIVYMHRFYAFHSFTHFHRNGIAAASLFLAAKVEEQPRKLEHVIKAANKCHPQSSSSAEPNYIDQAQDLVFNENVLLQTLGFDVAIDHPHTHVVKTCHLVKACKDLAQTSYFLASNSLHLTSMCLQYKPTVVACFCIYLACKWSRWEIPQSTEGKHWFHYVDKSVTMDLLKQLTDEFIAIYEKSPARLKSKLNSIKALAQGASSRNVSKDKSKMPQDDWKMGDMMKGYHSSINTSDTNGSLAYLGSDNSNQTPTHSQIVPPALLPPPPPQPTQQLMRKSDMHPSQHRAHHNLASSATSSSSSSSHHHSKPPYPAGESITDHKSKQQNFASNLVNRASNHPTIAASALNSARSNIPSSSSRSSSSNSLSLQRPPSQGHSMDGNYHKSSRERSSLPAPLSHGVLPHVALKISQKQDASSGRITSKDAMSRMQELMPKQTNSKIYPGAPPPYGSSQATTQSIKLDDMARNLLHNQRGFASNSSSNGNNAVAGQIVNANFHQVASISGATVQRPSSSSSNSKTSVHGMQQHAQQHSFEPPQPYGQPPQQTSHTNVGTNYGSLRSTNDLLPNEEQSAGSHSQNPAMQTLMGQTQSQAKNASLFSPDWNENKIQQQFNGIQNLTQHDAIGFKLSSSKPDRDSPKKERNSSGTPTKKDKNRMTNAVAAATSSSSSSMGALRASVNQPQTQQLKLIAAPKKLDSITGASLNELAGTSIGVSAGLKRLNDSTSFKSEDDVSQRDNKVRRIDNTTSLGYSDYKSLSGGESTKHPITITNGIETNPDLVRSLLKESLCTTNALIKPDPFLMPGLQPPAELLDPTAGPMSLYIDSNDARSADLLSTKPDEKFDSSKAEKKKKKDKHKHKEKDKDKTKDRDERKKHKKDKDKNKDRERESDNSEHVKIKISKEKLDGAGTSGEVFKIKIPKDCITNDASNGGSTHATNEQAPALKIKISKDKLENYSSGSTIPPTTITTTTITTATTSDQMHNQLMLMNKHNPTNVNAAPGIYSPFGINMQLPTAVNPHSNNNKKKERDRDREKDKKRINHELPKMNGNATMITGNATTLPAITTMPTTTTYAKNQNSSKI